MINSIGVSDVTQSTATITWTLNMPATGQVQYGKTTAYGTSTTPETSFNYSTHVQAVSGLSAGTLYHFRVSSTNAGGATATSGDQTFTTPAAPPAPTPTPVPTPSPTPVPTPVPTPAPTPAPPVGGSSTCTRNVNVDSSGNTDVTSSLQAFVDGSPNGSVICFASGGQYRVNGTLKLINRSNITLEGNNATIFQTTRSTGKILLIDNGGQDITVRNLTIKGANPNPGKWDLTYEHNHAIHIGGTLRVDLDHLTIKNIGGDALYIMGGYLSGGGFRFADTIRFHNSVVDGTGRMGLAITDGATNVSFDHNTLSRIAYYTFDVEPNGVHVQRPGRRRGRRQVHRQHDRDEALRRLPDRPDPGRRLPVRGHGHLGRRPRRRHRDRPQHHDATRRWAPSRSACSTTAARDRTSASSTTRRRPPRPDR